MVTRRAANLKDILYRRRALTSGLSSTITEPCTKPEENRKGRRCQTCNLISQKSSVTNNQITVSCRGGNCKTKNIVYAATCTLCNKNNVYIGKTITSLSQRVNGHRGQFYKLIGDNIDVNIDNFDDDNVLGAHIIRKHKKTEKSDFDSIFIFDILWIDFCLYLTNYSIKLIYMPIIRTGSMRRLKLCALFAYISNYSIKLIYISTYISRVINENVRKMAKTKTVNFKFMRQMIYHLVGHEILNITVYFIFHFNAYFSRKWRKRSKNLEKWKLKNTNLRGK